MTCPRSTFRCERTVWLARGLGSAGLLALAACQELPEVEIVGERVAIAPFHDAPVCVGSVAHLDAMVEELEAEVGLSSPELITYYWGAEGVSDACAAGVACAKVDNREVFGRMTAVRHELAHVIGGEVGTADHFVEEGFAYLHTDACASVHDFSRAPSDFLDIPFDEFIELGVHGFAAHFMMYMAHEHDPAAVLEWKDGAPKGSSADVQREAFEAAFGESLDIAGERWQLAAPELLCPPYIRAAPPLPADRPVSFATTLDCDSATTEGPFDDVFHSPPHLREDVGPFRLMFETWEVEVPLATSFEASFDGPAGSFAWLAGHPCSSGVTAGENDYEIRPGQPQSIVLDSCRWHVYLMAEPDDLADVTLDLVPEGAP